MPTDKPYTDQQLRELEERLVPSVRRMAIKTTTKILWRIARSLGQAVKRFFDMILALLGLLAAMPILLPVAALIKLTDGGSVLFWQTRIGKWGKPFRFPKFRSMVVNAEALQKQLLAENVHGDGVTFKLKRDPRITWIGRIIRKTSIDELPQLWCVLKGEMSLVGPRPALEREVSRYSLDDRRRLDATPGLTCIWQVSGRSDVPFPKQVLMDVEYIEQQSLWYDIKLLFKTIPAVITGRGAY
ncbi:MAG: sugar transferase [Pseudomonadota bacterium]